MKHRQVSNLSRGSSALGVGGGEGLLCLFPGPCRIVAAPKGARLVWRSDGKGEPEEGRRGLLGLWETFWSIWGHLTPWFSGWENDSEGHSDRRGRKSWTKRRRDGSMLRNPSQGVSAGPSRSGLPI